MIVLALIQITICKILQSNDKVQSSACLELQDVELNVMYLDLTYKPQSAVSSNYDKHFQITVCFPPFATTNSCCKTILDSAHREIRPCLQLSEPGEHLPRNINLRVLLAAF